MTTQPNWKERFVEEIIEKLEDDVRIIAQLPSEKLASECGSRLAQLMIAVRIALRETITLAERHTQEKMGADLLAIAAAWEYEDMQREVKRYLEAIRWNFPNYRNIIA
jgi:hypothetical protein